MNGLGQIFRTAFRLEHGKDDSHRFLGRLFVRQYVHCVNRLGQVFRVTFRLELGEPVRKRLAVVCRPRRNRQSRLGGIAFARRGAARFAPCLDNLLAIASRCELVGRQSRAGGLDFGDGCFEFGGCALDERTGFDRIRGDALSGEEPLE